MNAPQKTEDLTILNAVESVLAETPMGMTVAEIADDVGAGSLKVKDALRFLHERGKLVLIPAKRPADNRYQLLTLPGDTDSEGGETDVSREEMPKADPGLLASANRMLSDRPAGRGAQCEARNQMTLDDELKSLCNRLISADGEIVAEAVKQMNRLRLEIETLKNNYDVQVQEGEDLRQQLEALQRESMKGATLLSGQDRYTPAGYVMIASKRKPRRTMGAEKAIAAATSAVKGGAQRADVFALVPIGRAVKGAEWRPL